MPGFKDRPTFSLRTVFYREAVEVPAEQKLKVCTDFIKDSFENRNLSSNCAVTLQLDMIAPWPTYTMLSNTGNDADLFYCEQAIWNCEPFLAPFINGHGKIIFRQKSDDRCSTYDCRSLYFKHNPKTPKTSVILHVIPPALEQCFLGSFDLDDLHSLANLRAIRTNQQHSELLTDFRREWPTFILAARSRRTITRSEILSHAKFLLDKYRKLFS